MRSPRPQGSRLERRQILLALLAWSSNGGSQTARRRETGRWPSPKRPYTNEAQLMLNRLLATCEKIIRSAKGNGFHDRSMDAEGRGIALPVPANPAGIFCAGREV